MEVLRLQPVPLAQLLRDLLAFIARMTVYDARVRWETVLYDLRHLLDAQLVPLLGADLVVEVRAVEGELEAHAVGHVESGDDVVLDLSVGCRGECADGHLGVVLAELG